MRFLAVIWLCIYGFSMVLPHAITRELSDLPLLLEHFEKHKSREQHIDFLDFLAMHYTDDSPSDSESDHGALPFKHHHDCSDNICSSFFLAAIHSPDYTNGATHIRSEWPEALIQVPQSTSITIFQPPRNA